MDTDGDGSDDLSGGDCDDTDPALNVDDLDGDGYSTCDLDCDDNDATANLDDADGDGYATCAISTCFMFDLADSFGDGGTAMNGSLGRCECWYIDLLFWFFLQRRGLLTAGSVFQISWTEGSYVSEIVCYDQHCIRCCAY